MNAPKRYAAGVVHYPGDCTHIIGEVKGPTTYGQAVMAVAAEYDATTDRTRVAFVYCGPDDLARCTADEFGIVRLPLAERLA